MAQPYIGEIRMFAGNFAPAGWAFCDGQLLPISENDALFTPDRHDLRRRRRGDLRPARPAGPRADPPGHRATDHLPARRAAGIESVTLTAQQIPIHTHAAARVAAAGTAADPGGQRAGRQTATSTSTVQDAPSARMSAQAVDPGRRQPAARELPAVPVHQLHHLAVRHLPVARAEERTWPTRSSPRSGSSRSTSRRRAGRSATASSCRSRRTPRCSRCSAPSTAATASRPSPCPTSRAVRRCTPGQGPGLSLRDLGEIGGSRDRHAARERDAAHTHAMRAPSAAGEPAAPATRDRGARPRQRRQRLRGPRGQPGRPMAPQALAPAGGSLPHNNMQPYLTLNFCIALQGVFPPRG